MTDDAVTVRALGGVGRFGENGLLVSSGQTHILIDAGAGFFPHGADYGQDRRLLDPAAVPPITAYFITHGHEDHIGSLDVMLRTHPAPVFGTRFTLNAITHRLSTEAKHAATMTLLEPGAPQECGPFTVTGITVNHSLPEALLLVIDTPAGRMVHSGDYRGPRRPPVWGWPTDHDALNALGPVRALFIDSTGAPYAGQNEGDARLIAPLIDAMRTTTGAFVLTTYARHIERLHVIAEACRKSKRHMAFCGSGFTKSLGWASHLETHLGDVMLKRGAVMSVPRHRLCVVATGSQGERNGGLSRLVSQGFRGLTLRAGDAVAFSARTIPGQEVPLRALKAKIVRRGAHIVTALPHVSGHGTQDDIAALMTATQPAVVVPNHGDGYALEACRHLAAHICPDAETLRLGGRELTFTAEGVERRHYEEAPRLSVEDGGVVPAAHLLDRQQMARAGTLFVDVDDDGQYALTGVALSPRVDLKTWQDALNARAPLPRDALGVLETEVVGARKCPLLCAGPRLQLRCTPVDNRD